MKAIEIRKDIYWVGGIDWDLRNFHGYLTQRGSTYNSYLIIDEKVTLIDNVKHYLFEEQLGRISQIIDPAKIDYVVQNHIEMDHSGTLPKIMELCPNAKVVASPKGVEGLPKHYKKTWDFMTVKSGDVLDLGKRKLHFVQTPMVHWPDNMVSYCPEEKILFSNDAFGQHIASSERFDDEYPFNIMMHEAAKYYANIVLPYGMQVQRALQAVGGLDIETICPSHGLIIRKYIPEILEKYKKWSANQVDKKALIIYDTMWGSTRKIAKSIQEAFEAKNYQTRLFNLEYIHISDIMTEILTAKYICVGSPTLNNNILPTVASFLTYLKGLAPKGRIGMAFGSYGWGGQSVGIVENTLKECGFEMLDQIKLQYVPDKEILIKKEKNLINQIQ
ncbi:MAG: FprA family A-type flavoprotein [Candidatus Cloacimonetes bacterium]|nr:FprA family A-type flavoprotein [Candidatus Cloacimonadota bacterium]MCF7867241.1 FprA family A-type flavoprotein [Candidatus Cloacimonadota bacterium]MCF7882685.1 FprA family A-type flavoprotein [Candidatus Cloacimonadota bacterium]